MSGLKPTSSNAIGVKQDIKPKIVTKLSAYSAMNLLKNKCPSSKSSLVAAKSYLSVTSLFGKESGSRDSFNRISNSMKAPTIHESKASKTVERFLKTNKAAIKKGF